MKIWTYLESSTEVLAELDLTLEAFVGQDELIGFYNEAISDAEAEINKLGVEDEYFLKSASLALVQGTAAYALPADIYATKIRALQYSDGGTIIYPVKRIRRQNKFQIMAEIMALSTQNEDYRYILEHVDGSTGYQIVLYPPSRETNSNITVWYCREATKIPTLASGATLAAINATKLDIPQFNSFVRQYVKVCCAEKDQHPLLDEFIQKLQHQRQQMVGTLTEMVVDDDTLIQPDYSHYRDMN